MTDKIINTTTFTDGDILYAADLGDSIEALPSYIAANMLSLIIDGATATNQTNMLNDPLTSTSNLDTTNTTALWANGLVDEAVRTEVRAIRMDPDHEEYYQGQIEKFRAGAWEAR